jgi:hypothetical protein
MIVSMNKEDEKVKATEIKKNMKVEKKPLI